MRCAWAIDRVTPRELLRSCATRFNTIDSEENPVNTVSKYAIEQIRGTRAPTPEQMEEYTQVLLHIAGADGEISPREWEFLVHHGRTIGASDAVIEKWRAMDYKSHKLEDLTKSAFIKTRRKGLVYDAIRTASADGYAAAEKAAVARVATLLGVEPMVLAAIEAFVEMEASLTKMRGSLLYSD